MSARRPRPRPRSTRRSPSGYTIAAIQQPDQRHAATAAGLHLQPGAEVGDTYNYTVTSSGGGTAVTGSGSVTSATQDVTGINVSSLADGTLTFSVTLTDAAGNAGRRPRPRPRSTQTVPSGYTITADPARDQRRRRPPRPASRFAGAEVGTTYNYTVTSSGGGTAVTGSGSVTSATQRRHAASTSRRCPTAR